MNVAWRGSEPVCDVDGIQFSIPSFGWAVLWSTTREIHRGFLESAGPQNSCDHLSDKWQSAAWLELKCACMHANSCNFHALWESAGSWLSLNAFKWSQKILCTKKLARSLENLSGEINSFLFSCVQKIAGLYPSVRRRRRQRRPRHGHRQEGHAQEGDGRQLHHEDQEVVTVPLNLQLN